MKPKPSPSRFRRGDLVEVRPWSEITQTLDGARTLDGLPFMPEMLAFCGRRFRVYNHVVQAVIDGASLSHYAESYVREFRHDDVVLLEGLRCSGQNHDGCQRACMLFWKEAWLKRVDDATAESSPDSASAPQPDQPIQTVTASGGYFCQSTEFRNSTKPISFGKRIENLFRTIVIGNYGPLQVVRNTAVWAWCRARTKIIGPWPRGKQASTPSESLGLQAGEWVEVKTFPRSFRPWIKRARTVVSISRRIWFPTAAVVCGSGRAQTISSLRRQASCDISRTR